MHAYFLKVELAESYKLNLSKKPQGCSRSVTQASANCLIGKFCENHLDFYTIHCSWKVRRLLYIFNNMKIER